MKSSIWKSNATFIRNVFSLMHVQSFNQPSRFTTTSSIKPTILLSEKCVQRLKEIKVNGLLLRILVDSGGCSGFQYKFEVTKSPQINDYVIKQDGVEVVVDDVSVELLNGATIDYEDELIRSGFCVVKNPHVEKSCSCGVSFSLKI